MTVQMGRSWDRQPGETSKAYAGFSLFRDLPPAVRSLNRAFTEAKRRSEASRTARKRPVIGILGLKTS